MVRKRFRARLEPTSGGGAVCHLAFDVKAIFGRVRAPVRVKINGHEFRTTLAAMGDRYLLGINRRHRAAAGVDIGDLFTVTMELDLEPRVVDLPADLASSLARHDLRTAWDRMSYTHQREYAEWIVDARRPETRALRILRTVQLIQAKWQALSEVKQPQDGNGDVMTKRRATTKKKATVNKATAKKATAKKATATAKKASAKKTTAKKAAAKKATAKKTTAKKAAAKKAAANKAAARTATAKKAAAKKTTGKKAAAKKTTAKKAAAKKTTAKKAAAKKTTAKKAAAKK